MSLFQSNNPKEKQHSGILGVFSVDVIKWEPESDNEASLVVHKFEYEDFPNGGSYLIVNPSKMAIFTNNMSASKSKKNINTNIARINQKYMDLGIQGKNKIASCIKQGNEINSITNQFNIEPIREIIA